MIHESKRSWSPCSQTRSRFVRSCSSSEHHRAKACLAAGSPLTSSSWLCTIACTTADHADVEFTSSGVHCDGCSRWCAAAVPHGCDGEKTPTTIACVPPRAAFRPRAVYFVSEHSQRGRRRWYCTTRESRNPTVTTHRSTLSQRLLSFAITFPVKSALSYSLLAANCPEPSLTGCR